VGLLCRMGEVTVVPRLGAPHEVRLTLIFVLRMVVSVLRHRGGSGCAGKVLRRSRSAPLSVDDLIWADNLFGCGSD
jgi:hypothetical protein